MNKLNSRLANIAFKIFIVAKHWKTDEEIYSVSKWQRYLDNAKKRPKVHPTVVPDESLQEARNLKNKMQRDGATWEEWQNAVEKKFSPKKLKRENVYKTFKVDEKWDAKEKEVKEQRKEKRKITNAEHKKLYQNVSSMNGYVFGRQIHNLRNCYIDVDNSIDGEEPGYGQELFDKMFQGQDDSGKNILTHGNKNQLLNQLAKFHEMRPKRRRVRTDKQIQMDFVQRMKPDGYSTLKEFQRAKNRILQMNPADFMVLLHSVLADDEDELLGDRQVKGKSSGKKNNGSPQSTSIKPEKQPNYDDYNVDEF